VRLFGSLAGSSSNPRSVRLALLPFAAAALLAAPAWGQPAGGVAGDQTAQLAQAPAGKHRNDVLAVQVLLDRARFSPGEIDGLAGDNTAKAIRAFKRANGLPADGTIDSTLLERLGAGSTPLLRRYTITRDDVDGPFVDQIPGDMVAQAELERMAYTSPLELLAEKFHMSPGLLKALNPGADFASAGTEVLVVARREGKLAGKVTRVEVDKAEDRLRAYDAAGKLLAAYPATVGSASLPSPDGTTKVRTIAPDPAYYFDPENRTWGPDRRLKLAPGPNNPVGGTWIDLVKDGYGIHGTPEPAKIGKTASHGCVRLTNWDAEELAAAITMGADVEFVGG
jgi:lipoprotein-anchoring transpeptidase ErfK/SrfK